MTSRGKSVQRATTEEMDPDRAKRANSTFRGDPEEDSDGEPGVNEKENVEVERAKRANSTVREDKDDDEPGDKANAEVVKRCCPFQDLGLSNSVPLMLALLLCMSAVMYRKFTWIVRMWSISGEGHSVSKFVVILLFLYIPSFVMWFKELVGLVEVHLTKCRDGSLDHLNLMKRLFPEFHGRVQQWSGRWWDDIQRSYSYNFFSKTKSWAKVFYAPWAVLVALRIWDIVWIFFVCKGRNDRSCTKSWIGSMLYDYRQEACYDGNTAYVLCEKFIAYLPLIVLATITAVMGNLVQNLINKRYDAYGRTKTDGAGAESTLEATSSRSAKTSFTRKENAKNVASKTPDLGNDAMPSPNGSEDISSN